jgi:Mor family transcriptional regulator
MTDTATRPENLLEILQRLYPGLDLTALAQVAGGRQWYIPSPRPMEQAEKREAIRRDPCRDYKVVSRRYHCSVALVYEVWGERDQLKRV